jgi:hypothetical protein
MRRIKTLAVSVVVGLAAFACGDNGDNGGVTTAPLTAQIDPEWLLISSLTELVDWSPIIALGTFVGPPEVVGTQDEPDAGIADRILVYEFEPSEILRDAFAATSRWSSSSQPDGRLRVVMAGSDLAALRGDRSIAEYVDRRPELATFNALRTDEPVVAFLTASNLPPEMKGDRPELANVFAIVEGFGCFAVDDFDRNCRYVADDPGSNDVAIELSPDAVELEGLEGLDRSDALDAVRAEIASSSQVVVDTDFVPPDQIDPTYEVVRAPRQD